MLKRISSFLLSFILCISILPTGVISASADDYAGQLRKAGFTEEYIQPLVELHKKYPDWTFQALQTGLSLSQAVANERTPHSQQNIQKTSSNLANEFYCKCSKCFVDGDYRITEGKSWVAASEKAVKYYMNPLNFLDEKYIFQFESTSYNSAHNQSGVETIIKGTWMANSHIKYYDREKGATIWYTPGKLYSEAIMEAAKYSGLSAYYLASKIMQEVGGKKATAGGASGTYPGYEGIYNYYNIGAYSGAKDGLVWASLDSKGYVTNCSCRVREQPTTSSNSLVTLPTGTKLTYKSSTEKQSDGYIWYLISATYNGQVYNGYIRSDLVNYNNTDKYNRPWTNPYLSIYNGAKWISNNFTATQNTGYFQKFNVNPASKNRYEHEYMANVQGAASEAAIQYNAYKNANLLSAPKTFVIPIYSGLTDEPELDIVSGLTYSNVTGVTADISWNTVKGAGGYEVQLKTASGNWDTILNTADTSTMLTMLNLSTAYSVRVRAYCSYKGKTCYSGDWSKAVSFTTLAKDKAKAEIGTVEKLLFKNPYESGFDIVVDNVRGANMYQIQYSTDGASWKTLVCTAYPTRTLTGFSPSTTYYIRVMAYIKSGDTTLITNKYSPVYKFYTTSASASNTKLPFTDLGAYGSYDNYVAYTSIYNSYIKGTNPPKYNLFSPERPLTRAMVICIIYRMAGSKYDDGNNPHEVSPFDDITDTNVYYYNAACWALDKEITNQTTFCPDDYVTREQTARFLFNYAQRLGRIGDDGYKDIKLSAYNDAKYVHSWATEPMQWAVYNGLINGTQQGNLDPQSSTKRIHATKILYGFGVTSKVGSFK